MNKNNIVTIALAVICVIIVVPLVVAFLLSFSFISTDTSNEWIGFWGGYLGAIIGGLSTLLVFKYTITYNNELHNKDKRFEMSKEIIKLSSTYSFQIASVIKVSDEYVQSFSQEENMKLMHACNVLGNASEELSLSMLIYEKQYPQLKEICQGYKEVHWDYMQFIQFIDSEAENIFEDNIEKLMKNYEDKRDGIFKKVKEFNNVVSATLTEFI